MITKDFFESQEVLQVLLTSLFLFIYFAFLFVSQDNKGSACNVPTTVMNLFREAGPREPLHPSGMNIDLKTNLTWFLSRLEKCIT